MAVFEIQGPDGKTYEVDAPTIEQAAAAMQSFAQPAGGVATDSPAVSELEDKLKAAAAGGVNMATLGAADEATGLVKGLMTAPGEGTFREGYEGGRDAVRAEHDRLREEESGPYTAGQILGGAATLAIPGSTLATASRGTKLAPRIARSAAEGVAIGGAYGFNEGQGVEDRLNRAGAGGALGGIVGALTPTAGAAIQKYLDHRAGSKAIKSAVKAAPTTEALRREGQALYQQVDDAGVSVRPDAVRGTMDDIVQQLRSEGAGYTGSEKVLPASRAVMEAADDVGASANTVPFKELDVFRRYMGNAAGKDLANKGDTRAVTQAMETMDDFIRGLGSADVDAGDIKALQTALPKARETWAKMSRSQLLDDAIENAADYRTGQASGLRAQFQRIVKNPKLARGFSEPELKVMRRVVNGTLPEQVLNYMGSGLGMMGQMAVGGLTGSIPGALAGLATGAASRKGAEAVVRKNAEIARALVAGGGIEKLPVASEAPRKVIEALIRRGGSVVPQ